jgi:hypothetical protein
VRFYGVAPDRFAESPSWKGNFRLARYPPMIQKLIGSAAARMPSTIFCRVCQVGRSSSTGGAGIRHRGTVDRCSRLHLAFGLTGNPRRPPDGHSERNARVTSTRAARAVGRTDAITATAIGTNATYGASRHIRAFVNSWRISRVENFHNRAGRALCSSKPAIGVFGVNGAFDSHTLPPIKFSDLPIGS